MNKRWMILIAAALLTGGLSWANLPEDSAPDHDQTMSVEELLEAAKQAKTSGSQPAESSGQPGDKVKLSYEDDGTGLDASDTSWIDQAGKKPTPKLDEKTRKAADRIVDYYLRSYGKALQSPDWITRAVAVVSMNRIKHPRVTENLLEVMEKDKQPFVQVYAWEALYNRRDEMDEAQLRIWREKGLSLATKDKVLNGLLRVHLLEAIRPLGPTDQGRKLFKYYFVNTNLEYPADLPLLSAMGDLLGDWNDKTGVFT